MSFTNKLFCVLVAGILLTCLASMAFALGAGEYGFTAYDGDQFIEEIRIFDSDNGKPYTYECDGTTFYYGDYADSRITAWVNSGYDVYIVYSTGSEYNALCQLN